MMRTVAGGAIAVLAFLVLYAPAWINGAPVYWYDSLAYMSGGGSALSSGLGLETRFSEVERAVDPEPDPEATPPDPEAKKPASAAAPEPSGTAAPVDRAEDRISTARSPYYSVVVVLLADMAGPFAPLAAQVLLVIASGFFLLRAVFRDRRVTPALYLLAAVSVSVAGIFSITLLPDILAPLCILAVAVLFSFHDLLGALDKAFWAAVLVLGILSHTSHLAITVLLIPVGIILARLRKDGWGVKPALICAGAVAAGLLGMQVFSKTVEAVYGYTPRPFPMVAASVIVDGPGRAYLESTCPDNGYVYCDYLYTEARNIDDFLWAQNPTKGVYHRAGQAERNRMSDEQFSFLVDVLRYDFGGQFRASFARFIEQAQTNSLGHMSYTGDLRRELAGGLPEPERQLVLESAAYARDFPFAGLSALSQSASLLALAGTVILLAGTAAGEGACLGPSRTPSRAAIVSFVILVVAGIVANAGITGVLSNPQGRYGARVLWLLLVVFAIVFAWYRRTPRATPAADVASRRWHGA